MVGTDSAGLKATSDGYATLPEPDPNNFIEHADLTVDWLKGHCEEANGEFFREAIDRQLEAARLRPRPKLLPAQEPEPAPADGE